jgi:hypothetical protein
MYGGEHAVTADGANPFAKLGALLTESLPIDLQALHRAVDRSLGQLASTGDTLADFLEGDGVLPWLAGAAAISAAGAAAHYWQGRSRLRPPALPDGEAAFSSWSPESIARSGSR